MVIIGDTRPLANKNYTYTISGAIGKPKVKQWQVEYAGKILATNTNGVFNFNPSMAGKTVKLTAVVDMHGKDMNYFIHLQILAAMPIIEELYWLDINNERIGKRIVGYLDTVRLVIKTKNIPANDKIKVTIYEDEYADGHDEDSSRNMGTYEPYVDKKGYAYLTFDNIKVYQKKLNSMDYIDESIHEFYAKVVYSNKINQVKDTIQLQVKNELRKLVPPHVGSNPVVVGKVDSVKKENKTGLDFTFGVFIDGTLNNMYNTELKQKFGKEQPKNTTGLLMNKEDAEKIYDKKGDKKYKESSYENDLSNPAILFKNYTIDNIKTFRIYTEGIGTNSAPKGQSDHLGVEDYKKDDAMEGPAFGMGTAGIKDRVRKSIEDVMKKIKQMSTGQMNVYVKTITFDVFGFSRGAAAARHFVHIVKYPAYKAETTYTTSEFGEMKNVRAWDAFGYQLPQSYGNQMMPMYGYLGQLLKEAKLLDDQTVINVRFVGIYDTVPHHGLRQKNDIKDLGLNDVNKANYVVHMVAADEHRYNFDLVDISSVAKVSPDSGKKGGIELTYPGVHCDVGGAYVEGDGNTPYRIDVGRIKGPLEALQKEIVDKGWFKNDEMSIHFYTSGLMLSLARSFYRLQGSKKYVSNQYSYIPLHIMAEFCKKKDVPIDDIALQKFKRFTDNPVPDNVNFLEKIKKIYWKYSFEGGKPLKFVEPKVYTEPPIVYATGSPQATQYKLEWEKRQREGQIKLDAEVEKDNFDIKNLRYHYLHWNSSYGSSEESWGSFLSDKNKPNIVNGKRKRDVY